MKLKFTCEVDFDVLQKFVRTLNEQKSFITIDSFIEDKMKDFVEKFEKKQTGGGGPVTPPDNVDLVEELMEKSKKLAVGQLAQQVLIPLLELRVMTDWELEEMQKASGSVQLDRLKISFGRYNNNNFNMSFPLLVTPETRTHDTGNNFYVVPLTIGEQKFHLVSQWNAANHRQKLDFWIKEHVEKFLENADESQVEELKRIIRRI